MQELSYREFESACDQSNRCEHLIRIARVRCIRECISPSCYHEIYESDEVKPTIILVVFFLFFDQITNFCNEIFFFQLEEGEIDVRLNSFKGCFIQRLGRSRN